MNSCRISSHHSSFYRHGWHWPLLCAFGSVLGLKSSSVTWGILFDKRPQLGWLHRLAASCNVFVILSKFCSLPYLLHSSGRWLRLYLGYVVWRRLCRQNSRDRPLYLTVTPRTCSLTPTWGHWSQSLWWLQQYQQHLLWYLLCCLLCACSVFQAVKDLVAERMSLVITCRMTCLLTNVEAFVLQALQRFVDAVRFWLPFVGLVAIIVLVLTILT